MADALTPKKAKLTKGSPRIIDDHSWFYLERKGILLIHEVYRNGAHVQTDKVLIPWTMVKEALKSGSPAHD